MILSGKAEITATRLGDHLTLWIADSNNTMQIVFYDSATLGALTDAISGDVVTEFIEGTRLAEATAPCVTCGRAATEAMF
jgi:hypothetical protein